MRKKPNKPKLPLIAWRRCESIINTECGDILYEDWCYKEVKRLKPLWYRAFVAERTINGFRECCVKEKGGWDAKKEKRYINYSKR